MDVLTRDFGTVTVDEKDIITFIQPVFGFEEYTRYVLLCDEEIGVHFAWMQSLDDPELCFILADPDLMDANYKARIPESFIAANIGEGEYECWAVTVIPQNFSEATANLKSPILINNKDHRAAQVILEQNYPLRCPLMEKEEQSSC